MPNTIRILHVVGSLGIGGIQSYIMELYRNIDRSKVQFDFVVHIKTNHNYVEEIQNLGGRIFYINGNSFEKKKWNEYRKYWKYFFKKHQEYRIVHGHLRSTSALYLYEAKKSGCYTIAHSHSTSNGYGKSAKIKDIIQFPTRFIADYFMGCSTQANEWMFGKKRANSSACIVIHNAIDVKKFVYNAKTRKIVRQELGINENTFVVGTVGRLVEQKNQYILISAISEVKKIVSESLLLIIGDGPLKENLEKQIKLAELDKNVRMLQNRSDINRLLNGFDIFVLPSKNEGLGIAAIEAQANGLPVLVSPAVPKEAYITKLVEKVNDYSEASWANAIISKIGTPRSVFTKEIVNAGYDIKSCCLQLTDFYLTRFNELQSKT